MIFYYRNKKGVGLLKVNLEALKELAFKNGWSVPELAKHIGISYSYLFRVLKGQKKGGSKLFAGLYRLCAEHDLDFGALVFLADTLPADNEKK